MRRIYIVSARISLNISTAALRTPEAWCLTSCVRGKIPYYSGTILTHKFGLSQITETRAHDADVSPFSIRGSKRATADADLY
ncbi:MAG: hypothetical protein DMG14_04275 [Acidobacteria bacterium]|nr:MAG: hypothetical protein DMG14_04275 [Acidobacteriota bacterium]